MNKNEQSLLDVLKLLTPENSFIVFKSPVSNVEAQTLYRLWASGTKDEYGRIVVPGDIDISTIRSLASKKIVRNVDVRLATNHQPLIEITKEGKQIIRDIILYAEKSAYVGGVDNIDYEDIYRTSKFGPIKQAKVASRIEEHNWLQKLCNANKKH